MKTGKVEQNKGGKGGNEFQDNAPIQAQVLQVLLKKEGIVMET